MDLHVHIHRFEERFVELEHALEDPALFGDRERSREVTREYSRVRKLVEMGREYRRIATDIRKTESEASGALEDGEMVQLLEEELRSLNLQREDMETALRLEMLPPDPMDSRNTIVEIRAATGGAEASLFVGDLYRMFERYAELRRWVIEVLDTSPSEMGGLSRISFLVKGEDVYRRLKYESGVHRVQRVPVTEAQGRVHTSTATVAVLPEAEEVDVEIRQEDIEVRTCRASGPGGQGVNTTDSAVQILHLETGIMVRCADGRSQNQNKAKAMIELRSRLLAARKAAEEARYAADRRAQVGSGERNERIRTYNFSQNRVTDHRVELTLYNLSELLQGQMDSVIDPLMEHDARERLAAVLR